MSDLTEALLVTAKAKLQARIEALEAALRAADSLLEALNPNEPSGLSDAETSSLFNATHDEIRRALEGKS